MPGHFQLFFGAGGRNSESVVSSFSKSVQSTAFKVRNNQFWFHNARLFLHTCPSHLMLLPVPRLQTSSERLQKVLSRQEQGIIIRASEQQGPELRRHASDGGHHWPLLGATDGHHAGS